MSRIVVIDVWVIKAGTSAYHVMMGGDFSTANYRIGMVHKIKVPNKSAWAWGDGDVTCVGFKTRKQAIRHLVYASIKLYDTGKKPTIKTSNCLFYHPDAKRPDIPLA